MSSTTVIADQLPATSTWRSEAALRESLQEIGATLVLLTFREQQSGDGPVRDGRKMGRFISFPKAKAVGIGDLWGKEDKTKWLHLMSRGVIPDSAQERVAAVQAALRALQRLIIQTTSSSGIPGAPASTTTTAIRKPTTFNSLVKSIHQNNTKNNKGGIHRETSPLRASQQPEKQHHHPGVLLPYADISMRSSFRDLMGSCFKAPLLRSLEFSMGNTQEIAVEVLISFFQSARDVGVVESLSNTFCGPLLRLAGSGKASLRQAAATAVYTILSTQFGQGALSDTIKAAYKSAHPRVRSCAFHGLLYAFRHQRGASPYRTLTMFLPALTEVVHYGLTQEADPMVRLSAARGFWGLWFFDSSAAEHLLQTSPFFSGIRERRTIQSRLVSERVAALHILGVVLQQPSFQASPSTARRKNGFPSSLGDSDPARGKRAVPEDDKEGWSTILSFLRCSTPSNGAFLPSAMPIGGGIGGGGGGSVRFSVSPNRINAGMRGVGSNLGAVSPMDSTSGGAGQSVDKALSVVKACIARRAPAAQMRREEKEERNLYRRVYRNIKSSSANGDEGKEVVTYIGGDPVGKRRGLCPPWAGVISTDPFLNEQRMRSGKGVEEVKEEGRPSWRNASTARRSGKSVLKLASRDKGSGEDENGGDHDRLRGHSRPREKARVNERVSKMEVKDKMFMGNKKIRSAPGTPQLAMAGTPGKGSPMEERTPMRAPYNVSSSSSSSSLSSSSSHFHILSSPSPLFSIPQIDFDRFSAFWYQLPWTMRSSTYGHRSESAGKRSSERRIGQPNWGRVRYCFRSSLSPQYEWEPGRILEQYRGYTRDIREMQQQSIVNMREKLVDWKEGRDDDGTPLAHGPSSNVAVDNHSYPFSSTSPHYHHGYPSDRCTSWNRSQNDKRKSSEVSAFRQSTARNGCKGESKKGGHWPLYEVSGRRTEKNQWNFFDDADHDLDNSSEEEHDEKYSLVRACARLWRAYMKNVLLNLKGEEIMMGRTSSGGQTRRVGEDGKQFFFLEGRPYDLHPPPQFSSGPTPPPFSLFVVASMEELFLHDLDALEILRASRGHPLPLSGLHHDCSLGSSTIPGSLGRAHFDGSLLVPSVDVFFSGYPFCSSTTPAAAKRTTVLRRVRQHVMLLSLLIHIVFRQRLLTGRKNPAFLRLSKAKQDVKMRPELPTGTLMQGGRLISEKKYYNDLDREVEEEEIEAKEKMEEEGNEEKRCTGGRRVGKGGRMSATHSRSFPRPVGDQIEREGSHSPARCAGCFSHSTVPVYTKNNDDGKKGERMKEEGEWNCHEKDAGDSKRREGRHPQRTWLSSSSSPHSPRVRHRSPVSVGGTSPNREVRVAHAGCEISKVTMMTGGAEGGGRDGNGVGGDYWGLWTRMGRATRIEEQEKEEMCYRSLENIFSRLVHRLSEWAEEYSEPYSAVRRGALEVLQCILLASCHHSMPSFSFPLRLNALCGPLVRLCQKGLDDSSEEVRQTAMRCLYSFLFAPSVPLDTSLDGISSCLESWLTPPALYTSTAGYREVVLCVGRLLERERRRQDQSTSDYRPVSSHDSLTSGRPHPSSSSSPFSLSSFSPLPTMMVAVTRSVVQRLIAVLQQLLAHHVVEKIQQMCASVLVVLQWVVVEAREMVENMCSPSELRRLANWAASCSTWPEIW